MNKEIANTILKQIGGPNKLKAMIGAKQFLILKDGIGIKIAKYNNINYISITLNSSDLYDISYKKVWGTNIKDIKDSNNLYFDMLVEDIEESLQARLSL